MSISPLPLSYCTNVHPGETFELAFSALEKHTGQLAGRMDRPIAAGLWLPRSALTQCGHDANAIAGLRDWMRENGLVCYTMNAFPFGDFHAARVKENVYLPDWTAAERREYTCDVAEFLARLLPDGCEGSISTSPCAFKPLAAEPGYKPYFVELINTARFLTELRRTTGKMIRLAIEPEPCCVLETTDEAIEFFDQLRKHVAGSNVEGPVLEHIGLCYDVCHQAVEFEDVSTSISRLTDAGVRINKLHITCALELSDPTDQSAREHLARFVEPRYLHQTFGKLKTADGQTISIADLTKEHALSPPDDWLQCQAWRIHFHVPVNEQKLGPLATTRPSLIDALSAVKQLDYEPHLEVETYTWNVLPQEETNAPFDLTAGLQAELESTYELLDQLKE